MFASIVSTVAFLLTLSMVDLDDFNIRTNLTLRTTFLADMPTSQDVAILYGAVEVIRVDIDMTGSGDLMFATGDCLFTGSLQSTLVRF